MVQILSTVEEYTLFLASNPNCIIDFGAEWCGPCKRIAPFFEKLASQHSDIGFAKVDVDTPEMEPIVNKLVQDGIPMFISYHNSFIQGEVIGASEAAINGLVTNLLK